MFLMLGIILIVIMLVILVVNFWVMWICEVYYYFDFKNFDFFNDMWMIVIMFLMVGYGDIYFNSYCGRFVFVVIGLMGVGIIVFLVVVFVQKLE